MVIVWLGAGGHAAEGQAVCSSSLCAASLGLRKLKTLNPQSFLPLEQAGDCTQTRLQEEFPDESALLLHKTDGGKQENATERFHQIPGCFGQKV